MEIGGMDIDLSDRKTQVVIGGVALAFVYFATRKSGDGEVVENASVNPMTASDTASTPASTGSVYPGTGGTFGGSDNGFPTNPSPQTPNPDPSPPAANQKLASGYYPTQPLPTGGAKSIQYVVINKNGTPRLQAANAGARRTGPNVAYGKPVNIVSTFVAKDGREYGVSSIGTRYLMSDLQLNTKVTAASGKGGDVTLKTPLSVPPGSASIVAGTPRMMTAPKSRTLAGMADETFGADVRSSNNFVGNDIASAVTWPKRKQFKQGLASRFPVSSDETNPNPYGGASAFSMTGSPYNAAGQVTVKEGQTLRDLSRAAYGTDRWWSRIAQLNGIGQSPQAGSVVRV